MPRTSLKEQLYRITPLRRITQAALLRGSPDCVFVWIPKTAGTFLYQWLQDNIGMRKMNVPRDYMAFPGFGSATFGHVHYLSLLYQGIVPHAFHERSYRFSVVRNPYSRIASLYNYLCIDQSYNKSFPAFLEDVFLRRPPVGLYNHRGISQANPQVDWLMDWNGGFIVQDIFKVEKINDALGLLVERFSISSPIPVKNRNVSHKIIFDESFDRETIEKINDIYSRDFSLLGYAKR